MESDQIGKPLKLMINCTLQYFRCMCSCYAADLS